METPFFAPLSRRFWGGSQKLRCLEVLGTKAIDITHPCLGCRQKSVVSGPNLNLNYIVGGFNNFEQ